MSSSSHIPAGFCPYCDYAMDPGCCPECGRDVPAGKLASSARRQRIKRRAKRTAKVILIAVLLAGTGYGVYHETRPHRWVTYCTTDYLLSLDWRDRDNIQSELWSRVFHKKLNEPQLKSFLTGVATPRNLNIRTPRPSGSTTYLDGPSFENLCMFVCGGMIGRDDLFTEESVGEELRVNGNVTCRSDGRLNIETELKNVVPHLRPGTHRIEYRRKIQFDTMRALDDPEILKIVSIPYLPCTVFVSTYQDINIQDAPVESMLQPKYDETIVDRLRTEQWFSQIGDDWFSRYIKKSDIQLAGSCKIKAISIETGEVRCRTEFLIPRDNCTVRSIIAGCIDDQTYIDVVFIPDAALAFEFGFDEYFNGVVEWHDVKINEGMPVFGAPDAVRPYDPSEFESLAVNEMPTRQPSFTARTDSASLDIAAITNQRRLEFRMTLQ